MLATVSAWPDTADVAAALERLTQLADEHLPDPTRIDVQVHDDGTFNCRATHVHTDDHHEVFWLRDGTITYQVIVDGEVREEQAIEPTAV